MLAFYLGGLVATALLASIVAIEDGAELDGEVAFGALCWPVPLPWMLWNLWRDGRP